MTRRCLAGALLAVVQLVPAPVRADGGPTKQECVAANESAQDLRRAGQLREARTQLALCVSERCPGPVREDCAQRLSEIDTAMPSLVLVARDRSGNDMSAVVVTMDGLPFVDSLDGSAIQVDPGEHHFVFEGYGLPAIEKVVLVREGDRGRHVNVVLGPPPAEPVDSGDSLFAGATRRTVAFAVGGAGTVALVLGGALGLVAKATYDHALQSECRGNPKGCSWQGAEDGESAHALATASTVAFVAAGVLLAGGAALYVTAPRASSVSMGPAVRAGGAELRVRAAW
jgi:hypothetical protein